MKLKTICNILKTNKIVIRRLSKGIGDNLMLSCLAREIKKKYPLKRIIVETEYPELFENNPNVDYASKGKQFPFYLKPKYRVDGSTEIHVLDQLMDQVPLEINSFESKVEMFISNSEKEEMMNHVPSNYIVTSPVGKNTFSSNRKEWGFEQFQALVDHLKEYTFVQIGLKKDPLLKNVLDLRGFPLRKSATIIQNSLCGVFLEGGLMHIANAVEKQSVIIFGGALRPDIFGYESNINIYRKVHCGPCLTSYCSMTTCPTMICMKQIHPTDVAKAIETLLNKANT